MGRMRFNAAQIWGSRMTPLERQRSGKPDHERQYNFVAADGTVLMSQLDLASFWGRVTVDTKFQCWEWRGNRNNKGYGRFRGIAAHRLTYILMNGPVDDGLIVRHRCDNPSCCNPHHLEVGTKKDNTHDALKRGRFALGNRHWKTKIPDEDIPYIRRNPERLTVTELAEKFDVGKATIESIRRGKSRKRVPNPTPGGKGK